MEIAALVVVIVVGTIALTGGQRHVNETKDLPLRSASEEAHGCGIAAGWWLLGILGIAAGFLMFYGGA